jgi:hypothetical protein
MKKRKKEREIGVEKWLDLKAAKQYVQASAWSD